jgi:putative transposase
MLNFDKKKWIIKQKEKGELTNQEIADSQRVSERTIQSLWAAYRIEGLKSLREKPRGRKADEIPEKIRQKILEKRKQGYGIRTIEGLLSLDGIKVSHNKIHRVLRAEGLVIPEPKKARRRHYIRWERKHSNSLWQTDFCWQERLQCWLTAYLDDHSRFIVGIQYTKIATTEVAIDLFDKSRKRFGKPREVLSDRGTQFYAPLGEKSAYTEYLKSINVEHILASVKKPTTTGKLERFWLTHNKERWNFNSLQDFVRFYNYKRPHMSLDYQTPYEVYSNDLMG